MFENMRANKEKNKLDIKNKNVIEKKNLRLDVIIKKKNEKNR